MSHLCRNWNCVLNHKNEKCESPENFLTNFKKKLKFIFEYEYRSFFCYEDNALLGYLSSRFKYVTAYTLDALLCFLWLWQKQPGEGRVYSSFEVTLIKGSQEIIKAGTWWQRLKQKQWKNEIDLLPVICSVCFLIFPGWTVQGWHRHTHRPI